MPKIDKIWILRIMCAILAGVSVTFHMYGPAVTFMLLWTMIRRPRSRE